MKMDKQVILQDRELRFNPTVATIELPLDTCAILTSKKHHELKLVVTPRTYHSKFTCRLGKIHEDNNQLTVYKVEIKKISPNLAGVFSFSIILETYDCTKQELDDRKELARKQIDEMEDLMGINKPTGIELKKDLDSLFRKLLYKGSR